MNNQYKSFTIILILFFLAGNFLFAQNNTSSPYSKFGTGDLNNIAFGRNLAIGGTGFGIRDHHFLNIKNPASITSIDSLNFLFETGVFYQYTKTQTSDFERDYNDGNLSHLVLGHRYTKWLMGAYGVMPYSNIGYNFRTEESLESEDSKVYTDWIGTGGINKLFYNLGYKMTKNFSLGAEAAFFYGPFNESKKTWALVQPDNSTYYYTDTYYSGLIFKGALQYSLNLGDKGTNLTIGGTISPQQKLRGKTNIRIDQYYGEVYIDSMYYDKLRTTPIILPLTYGAGIGFTWRGKYLFAADYERAGWSVNTDRAYIDQTIYSFGIERLPRNSLNYLNRCSYRLGLRYDSGYIMYRKNNISDIRFTAGIGFPIQKTASMINLSVEAGRKGSKRMGLVMEDYVKFTVAFSFQDLWFIERKVN